MTARAIDLNADVGEGYDDEPLLPLVTTINIACGAHAGDEDTMTRTVARALDLGLAIGAHPGYRDRATFGRAPLALPQADVRALVAEQIETLARIADRQGARITHVKPHGALYNQAAADAGLARAIAEAVLQVDASLRLVGPPGSASTNVAATLGLAVVEEAFADRRYTADGSLAPRGQEGAVIADPDAAAAQAVAIARGEPIETVDGSTITVRAGTLCLHGDTPGAVENARAVRAALARAGIEIAPAL